MRAFCKRASHTALFVKGRPLRIFTHAFPKNKKKERTFMNANTIYILSAIFSIAATVLAFIFITPEAKRNTLNKFGKFLHDILNFKSLLIEKLLKGAYILSTAFVLFYGFFYRINCDNIKACILFVRKCNHYICFLMCTIGIKECTA